MSYKKDKLIHVIDRDTTKESASINGTMVYFYVPGTDEVLFKKPNKVILPGSIFTAAKHFNITPNVKTPTYNSELVLENSVIEESGVAGVRREEQIVLFAIGIGGCGQTGDQVFDVNYAKWIAPTELIPFRYPLVVDDIAPELRSTYFGRKVIGDRAAYYFKKFETDPVLYQRYKDGTPITENVYTSTRTEEIETYVELRLKVTKEEARDFFRQTSGISQAVVNTISLCTAWAKNIDGIVHYQDIRPITKINIPNEYLIDLEKGMDIIYHIYY